MKALLLFAFSSVVSIICPSTLFAAEQSNEVDSLLEGAELIQKKMLDILGKQGLEALPAEKEDFDPDKHDALMQIEKDDIESGKIIEEHLKGYTLNGKVIRHSQVIVAK